MKRYIIKPAEPKWKDLPKGEVRSAYDYQEYMIGCHGYERQHLVGSVGQGTKVHTFSTVSKIEGNTLYIASCYSYCGSAKWTSQLYIDPTQSAKCTCKRCQQ